MTQPAIIISRASPSGPSVSVGKSKGVPPPGRGAHRVPLAACPPVFADRCGHWRASRQWHPELDVPGARAGCHSAPMLSGTSLRPKVNRS